MTIRHHLRDGERFAEAFGCELRCHVDGLHEFTDGPDVRGLHFGEVLAPGITALEVDEISPEETALHLEYGGGAIAFADGLIRARRRAAALRPRLSDRRRPRAREARAGFRIRPAARARVRRTAFCARYSAPGRRQASAARVSRGSGLSASAPTTRRRLRSSGGLPHRVAIGVGRAESGN